MDGNRSFPKLISAASLADLLDVSSRTIRAWQKEGRLPYIKISPGTVRYDVAEVMAALEERKVHTRKPRRSDLN